MTKTVREVLAGFQRVENIQDAHGVLDKRVRDWWFCVGNGGDLNVNCGGNCIVGFRINRGGSGTIYLVYNDDAGRLWHHRKAAGEKTDGGSCPPSVLKFVESI